MANQGVNNHKRADLPIHRRADAPTRRGAAYCTLAW